MRFNSLEYVGIPANAENPKKPISFKYTDKNWQLANKLYTMFWSKKHESITCKENLVAILEFVKFEAQFFSKFRKKSEMVKND